MRSGALVVKVGPLARGLGPQGACEPWGFPVEERSEDGAGHRGGSSAACAQVAAPGGSEAGGEFLMRGVEFVTCLRSRERLQAAAVAVVRTRYRHCPGHQL